MKCTKASGQWNLTRQTSEVSEVFRDFGRSVVAILRRIPWDSRPEGAGLDSPGRQPWEHVSSSTDQGPAGRHPLAESSDGPLGLEESLASDFPGLRPGLSSQAPWGPRSENLRRMATTLLWKSLGTRSLAARLKPGIQHQLRVLTSHSPNSARAGNETTSRRRVRTLRSATRVSTVAPKSLAGLTHPFLPSAFYQTPRLISLRATRLTFSKNARQRTL